MSAARIATAIVTTAIVATRIGQAVTMLLVMTGQLSELGVELCLIVAAVSGDITKTESALIAVEIIDQVKRVVNGRSVDVIRVDNFDVSRNSH